MRAFITGMGWVTATNLGCGRDHTWVEMKPGNLPEIKRKAVFNEPYPHFGRLDRYSRLGLSAIAFALKDAGLDQWTHRRPIGIIASTVHGCLDTDINYFETVMPGDGRLASPQQFAYTLPNSYLGEAAIHFGLTGTCYIINEATISSLWCLRLVMLSMAGGQFETAIGGGCDLGHCPPFSASGEKSCGALFFVIEKTIKRDCLAYGELLLDKSGMLALNGTKVSTLQTLAQNCIAALSNKKPRSLLG